MSEETLEHQLNHALYLIHISKQALEFYGKSANYHDDNPHELSSMHEDTCTVKMDEGGRARKVLEEIEQQYRKVVP